MPGSSMCLLKGGIEILPPMAELVEGRQSFVDLKQEVKSLSGSRFADFLIFPLFRWAVPVTK